MFFQKQNKYKMNPDMANQTLQNVFAACDRESNATPFDKLILRKRANTRVYDRLILLTSLFLLLTFLAPLFIVPVSTMLGKRTNSESPALVRDYVEDSCLYLELKGDHIVYEEAYLEKADGTIIPVLSFDRETKTLCFPYVDNAESNIYIPIRGSDPLHLLLSPQ